MRKRTDNLKPKRRRLRLALGLCAVCVLSQAGCSSTRDRQDPLFGTHSTTPANAPTGTPAASPKTSGLPPLPKNGIDETNAGLASLPGSRPLGIGPNGWPVAPGTKSPTAPGGIPASNVPSGNTPKVIALPREGDVPSVMTVGSVAQAQKADEALKAQLKAAGVVFERQDPIPGGGTKLSVMVPDKGNPDNSRIIEATAADYPSAVMAVLQKIRQ